MSHLLVPPMVGILGILFWINTSDSADFPCPAPNEQLAHIMSLGTCKVRHKAYSSWVPQS